MGLRKELWELENLLLEGRGRNLLVEGRLVGLGVVVVAGGRVVLVRRRVRPRLGLKRDLDLDVELSTWRRTLLLALLVEACLRLSDELE